MFKHYVRNLDAGLNKNFPPHKIEETQLSDLNNVNFRRGKWVKRDGYTLLAAAPDANAVIEIVDYQRRDLAKHLLIATTQNIYRYNAGTWNTKLALGSSRTSKDKWFFTEINNTLYATNGVDSIYFVGDPSSSSFAAVAWDTTNGGRNVQKAKVILAHFQRLLLFNVQDTTDGAVGYRMLYTNPLDYDRVENTNFTDFDWSHAPVLNAKKIAGRLIAVYKEDSVATVQDEGTGKGFVPKLVQGAGLIAAKAVTDHPQGHFYVSQDGFYINSGAGIKPVGEENVVAWFFETLDITNVGNIYCFTDWFNKEIHILFPTNGDQPNKVLVYNWYYENWCTWDYNAYCGFYRYRGLTSRETYFGSTSGNVKKRGGSLDNNSPIPTLLRTKAFFSNFDPNLLQKLPPTDYALINGINTDAKPTGINGATVRVKTADLGTDTFVNAAEATITDIDGITPRADVVAKGAAYLIYEVENFDEISELVVEIRDGGDTNG